MDSLYHRLQCTVIECSDTDTVVHFLDLHDTARAQGADLWIEFGNQSSKNLHDSATVTEI